jgi:hypothetical protein
MYSELDNIDISLKQGQVLKEFNEQHEQYIDFKKIMETCSPDICSIKEGMDSGEMGKDTNANVEKTMKHIQKLDDRFSRTLSRYNVIQKQIKEETVTKSHNYDTWKNHLGKVVENNDNFFYVNNYGYTHKYSKSGLNANHKGCPSYSKASKINNVDFDKLPSGQDMVPGQACQIAGKNIKNEKTNEYAFVDVRGVKHIYSDDSWDNKQTMCKSHALSLDNKAYDAIPSGPNMTDKDLCVKVDVDPELFMEMYRLNNELTKVARELYYEINKLAIKDAKMKKRIEQKSSQVNNYMQSLDKERIELVDFEKNFDTINTQESDSELKVNSDYYHYLAFSFAALAIGGITLKLLAQND